MEDGGKKAGLSKGGCKIFFLSLPISGKSLFKAKMPNWATSMS